MPASPLGGRKGEELRGHIGLHSFTQASSAWSWTCWPRHCRRCLARQDGACHCGPKLLPVFGPSYYGEPSSESLKDFSGVALEFNLIQAGVAEGSAASDFRALTLSQAKMRQEDSSPPLFCRAQVRHQQSPVPRNISTARIPKMPCRMPSIGHIETTMRLLSRDMVHHSHHRA